MAMALLGAIAFSCSIAAAQSAQVSDADAQALVQAHCVMCHARKPAHPSFSEPPANVTLETIEEVKRFAPAIMLQVVVNKAMPVGNEMTDAERERLAQWLGALK